MRSLFYFLCFSVFKAVVTESSLFQPGEDWNPASGSAMNMVRVAGVPGLSPVGLHLDLFTSKQIPRPARLTGQRMLEPEDP